MTGDLASNDSVVVLNWAHDGHGIMIAADWLVKNSLALKRLERVLPCWEQPVDVWAISTQQSNQSAKVPLLIELLKEEMGVLQVAWHSGAFRNFPHPSGPVFRVSVEPRK